MAAALSAGAVRWCPVRYGAVLQFCSSVLHGASLEVVRVSSPDADAVL